MGKNGLRLIILISGVIDAVIASTSMAIQKSAVRSLAEALHYLRGITPNTKSK
jgi:hypothetical protein